MSKSILDSIKVQNENVENKLILDVQLEPEVELEKTYLDLEIKTAETPKKNCPQPGHNSKLSIKDDIDTGFSVDDSLDLNVCAAPGEKLQQPLYKSNYLSEFKTEEEKRKARQNIGLFDETDVVGMSLLTTGSPSTTFSALQSLVVKSLELGKVPFAVQTTAKAVMVEVNGNFVTLLEYLNSGNRDLADVNARIDKLVNKSKEGSAITTVGDMVHFLDGYSNTLQLKTALDQFLTFESHGVIE